MRKIWVLIEYDQFERSKIIAAYESEELARRHLAILGGRDHGFDYDEVTVLTELPASITS